MRMTIKLDTIGAVNDFHEIVSHYNYDVDLVSGKYRVNAKSIMGVFSLDLSEPIVVEADSDEAGELFAELSLYKAKD